MQLDVIKKRLEDELAGRRSHSWKDMGNKYFHGLRTAKLALKMRTVILPDITDQDELLTVAAWYHDILNGDDDHCRRGASLTRRMLEGLADKKEIDRICDMIFVHDDRDTEYDPIIRILQDADLIDHFGAYDIVLTASYGMQNGETIDELSENFFRSRLDAISAHRPLIHYDLSLKLMDERLDYQLSFAKRLKDELDCSLPM